MNKKEQEEFRASISQFLTQLNTSIVEFKTEANKRIEKVEKQIEKTYLPVNLEEEILRTAQQSISSAIAGTFSGYGNPLSKFVLEVVNENAVFLKDIISSSFNQVIRTDNFKESIVSAFSHKVARSIISNNDGLFDKVSNDLKQDTVFKSKMALAVAVVVEECLKNK